jgi:thymidylate kinase
VAAEFKALQDERFHVVDATQSIEHVHESVLAVVKQVLAAQEAGQLPLADLWSH